MASSELLSKCQILPTQTALFKVASSRAPIGDLPRIPRVECSLRKMSSTWSFSPAWPIQTCIVCLCSITF